MNYIFSEFEKAKKTFMQWLTGLSQQFSITVFPLIIIPGFKYFNQPLGGRKLERGAVSPISIHEF